MDDVRKIAAGLTEAQRLSCPSCAGKGYHEYEGSPDRWPCANCRVPEPGVVALVASRITPVQRAYLLAYPPTLERHPVTPEQWDAMLECFFIEADNAVDLGDGIIWPATRHWFGGSEAHYAGDGRDWKLWHFYNATGLAVRAHIERTTDAG